jgi:hypothetical protein
VLRLHNGTVSKLFFSLVPLWCAAVLGLTSATEARASFTGNYSLDNFTLTNSSPVGNGTATTPDSGLSLVLTGPNDGSGDPGTVDFTILAPASGLISFDYLYSSQDLPTYDFAGYLLGNSFHQLADTDGQSGTVQFQITAGTVFGFRVGTLDNTGEPGVLTVSNFESSAVVSPEPGPLSLVLLGFIAAGLLVKAGSRRRHEEERQ